MASAVENCDVNANESEAESGDKTKPDAPEPTELEQGRVWRPRNVATQADKQGIGPVLRTTVKPVKRFRPDSSNDKANPSPSRKKRLKTSTLPGPSTSKPDDSTLSSQAEVYKVKTVGNNTGGVSEVSSPDGKGSITAEPDKTEKGVTCDTQGGEGKDSAPVKKKRVWEQWTVEDKNYFFEAVAMYGKDFEAIRTAIAHKHRKKGEECVAKTKDQVRHLYYRTWTMISKLIDTDAYPLNINKAFQELYAVINYGELRKKMGGNLKKKGIDKLNELIREGTTSTRFKGKNFRIKTPSCRALKKMNPEYQGKEGISDLPLVSDTRRMKIPLYVTVELCPLTMAAWNQVHSIAHNPRLKIRMSVESPISSLFAYLERKWKPLSGRLLWFANNGQSKNHSSLQKTSKNATSQWEGTLVIQTPPDASVNTRIMVFQVANSKTHCVVSYALRKSSQNTEKSPEASIAETTCDLDAKKIVGAETEDSADAASFKVQNGCLSESEAVDSCLSSEEDDYDSANEDAFKDDQDSARPQSTSEKIRNSPKSHDEISTDEGNAEVQSLDTTFMLKDKESTNTSPPTSMSAAVVSDSEPKSEEIRDDAAQDNTTVDCAKSPDETLKDESDFVLRISLSESANADKNADVQEENQTETSNPNAESSDAPKDSTSPKAHKTNDTVKEISSPDRIEPCDAVMDVSKAPPDKNKKGKKLLISAKLFGEPTKGKRRKNAKKNKSFMKAVQKWNANDCGKTTIAEIYMMLGKPSVFRLCYHWLQNASENSQNEESNVPEAEKQNNNKKSNAEKTFSLSTGLIALIQAANLSQQIKKQENKAASEESTPQQRPKSPAVKLKSTAIQCDIIKSNHKAEEKSRSNPASSNFASSNPHGRNVSKIIPVETVIVDSLPISGFAIPAVPHNRPRKIAANPNKPVQGTKVSAETMNWLLQRERSRGSRMFRRPIVVDKQSPAQKPIRISNNYRQMKTFSIVTKGPNKVGFLPSGPVLASRSAAPDLQTSDVPSTSSQNMSLNIDQLLLDTHNNTPTGDVTPGNLLAQAAKEAGVAPPTPVKNPQPASHNEMDLDTQSFMTVTNMTHDTVTSSVEDVMPQSVATPFTGIENMSSTINVSAGTENVLDVALVQDTRLEHNEPVLNALSPIMTPAKNPMVCPSTSLSSSPNASSLPSSLTVNSTVVNSLPELSWPGHDIPSSAFPIMGETLIDKLADREADVVLSSLNTNSPEKNNNSKTGGSSNAPFLSPPTIMEENSNGPPLSRLSFDLQMTPVKSSGLPVHPWTINTNSRDSMGLSSLLNTPQKIILSDAEDSLDGLIPRHVRLSPEKTKEKAPETARRITPELVLPSNVENGSSSPVADPKNRLDSSSSNFLCGADSAVELQLQSLMNENSVDLVSKFQDLVRHTTECDELSALASDENARDGHIAMENSFQNADSARAGQNKGDGR